MHNLAYRANQGEFTQPRHGVPRVGMGLDYFIVHTQLIEPNDKNTTRLVTLIELIFAHLPRVGRDIMTDFAHLPLEGRELNLLIFAHLPGRPRYR